MKETTKIMVVVTAVKEELEKSGNVKTVHAWGQMGKCTFQMNLKSSTESALLRSFVHILQVSKKTPF